MIDRITILGGSSVYIPELILSMIARNVNVKEILLFGQEGQKLPIVASFCQRLVDKSGYPTRVNTSCDIREAVKGAKYVVNHVRVGGMRARMRDEMIPPKYDMIGDESLGAGGISNAMRTLPVLFGFAQVIEEENPDTTLINLTNPMGIVVEALSRYTKIKVYGASDSPGIYTKKIADVLQQEPAALSIDYFGLHQLGWIQDVKVDGRSRMSQLLEILEEHQEEEFDYDLIELFRMIPTRSMGMFFHRAEILKKQQDCYRFRAEVLYEAEKQIIKLYDNEHLNEIPDLTRQRNAIWYQETVIPLIEALESEAPREMVLCLPNNATIRDFPEGCSVEVPATLQGKSFQARKVGSLPGFLRGVFLAVKESDRLVIEAVKHKSYDYALQSLTVNPFVPSIGTAKRYLERIIKEDELVLH